MKNFFRLSVITLLLIFVSFGYKVYANQTELENQTQNDLFTDDSDDGVYKLFATTNQRIFIQLNTRNGIMSLVQFGMDGEDRLKTFLNLKVLASEEEEENGRFTLYPTKNIWTFILLDQINGETWQVQWSIEPSERFVELIMYSL